MKKVYKILAVIVSVLVLVSCTTFRASLDELKGAEIEISTAQE